MPHRFNINEEEILSAGNDKCFRAGVNKIFNWVIN